MLKFLTVNCGGRAIVLAVAVWAVFLGVPGVWLWSVDRQDRLSRQLIAAIKREDTVAALRALEQGADANVRDEPSVSPWVRLSQVLSRSPPAAPSGPTPLLQLLQYDVMAQDTGQSLDPPPREHVDLVEALLAHGADVNKTDTGGDAPLLYALADRRKGATARVLIAHGAHVSGGRADEYLYEAIDVCDDNAVVESMLQHGADPNRRISGGLWFPLSVAIYHHNSAAVKSLLSHHADPNIRMWDPVENNYNLVRPLRFAEQLHYTAIANLLHDAGAKP